MQPHPRRRRAELHRIHRATVVDAAELGHFCRHHRAQPCPHSRCCRCRTELGRRRPQLPSSQASGDEATTWREERMTGGDAGYGDGAMTQREERKTGGGGAGCECQMRMRNRERESKERRERGGDEEMSGQQRLIISPHVGRLLTRAFSVSQICVLAILFLCRKGCHRKFFPNILNLQKSYEFFFNPNSQRA